MVATSTTSHPFQPPAASAAVPQLHPRRSRPHARNLEAPRLDWIPEIMERHVRPSLEHRASQTISGEHETIDLTNDEDEPLQAFRHRHTARAPRLPRFADMDILAEGQDVVDLTEAEPDVQILRTRVRTPPQARAHQPPHAFAHLQRPESPLFFPDAIDLDLNDASDAHLLFHDEVGLMQHLRQLMPPYFRRHAGQQPFGVQHQVHAYNIQPMPNLQYERHEDEKPVHVPPPPVPQGYTRSPTTEDVVVCPNCDEELIQRAPEETATAVKKKGKAPSRKEMEEHPFWVVRECGHVSRSVFGLHQIVL